MRKLGWASLNVKPLFYRHGRIEVVPENYFFIGTISKAWTDKFGVVIAQGELDVRDRIAIEFPVEFEEIEVESIKVNDATVQHATVNDPAGLLWPRTKAKLREGMRVFRVQ